MTKLERWGHVAAICQAVATTIALLLGAWWFKEQRQTYPHAKLEQTVDVVPVREGVAAIEVRIQFENIGKRRIELKAARIMLQNVSGKTYDYPFLATLNGAAYWRATRPSDWQNNQFNAGELRWPVLKQYDGAIDSRVEPGETDTLMFTFLVTCSRGDYRNASRLRRLRIASDIIKPDSSGDKGFAWKARTFADVSKQCDGNGATQ